MKVGFTGSRKGLNNVQKKALHEFFKNNDIKQFHHGDCIGADESAHKIAVKYNVAIVIHPPDKKGARAFCENGKVLDELPFLKRNKAIVEDCDILLACPDGNIEKQRSGTWATIRHAKKLGKQLFIFYPSNDK